jgi:hypothetical protein
MNLPGEIMGRGKLNIEGLDNLHSQPNIVWVIRPMMMRF